MTSDIEEILEAMLPVYDLFEPTVYNTAVDDVVAKQMVTTATNSGKAQAIADMRQRFPEAIAKIEALITKEIKQARLDENNRYLEMLKTGNWRSFGIEVTERLKELNKD